jgi:hypothetical protein
MGLTVTTIENVESAFANESSRLALSRSPFDESRPADRAIESELKLSAQWIVHVINRDFP